MVNVRASMLLAMICILPLAGCSNGKMTEDRQAVRYFSSPQEAVEIGSWLVRHEDWSQLASYYDLRGTDLSREQLESGSLFIAEDQADSGPENIARYRQPFPPLFRFDHVEDMADKHVKKVVVSLATEQPDGTLQIATDEFHLRKSKHGYRLLPE